MHSKFNVSHEIAEQAAGAGSCGCFRRTLQIAAWLVLFAVCLAAPAARAQTYVEGSGYDSFTFTIPQGVATLEIFTCTSCSGGDCTDPGISVTGPGGSWSDDDSYPDTGGPYGDECCANSCNAYIQITNPAAGDYSVSCWRQPEYVYWRYRLAPVAPTITSQPVNQIPSLASPVKIAAGYCSGAKVLSDGTVITSGGDNRYGQLGDGTTTNTCLPVQVSGLSGVASVAEGWFHRLAVKSDGTVWAWGYNSFGQLGDDTTTNRLTPVQISGLNGMVAVAAGYAHSLAVKSDGTVWAWGYNSLGQLGCGTNTNHLTPVQVSGLSGVVAVAAGYYHSLALKSDGTVWAWGDNWSGALGNGTTTNSTTPLFVSGLNGVMAVAGGYGHSLAMKSDGTVWAWGYNCCGQLGNGTNETSLTPIQTSGLTGVIALASGFMNCLALKSDGTIWGWGWGTIFDCSWTPVPIPLCGFSVTAAGVPNPTYRWQRKLAGQTTFTNLTNDATYSGVTSSVLMLKNLTMAMNGDQFRCVVTNSQGSVTSNAATLTFPLPIISIVSGNNQTGTAGQFNTQAFDVAVWNSAGTQPLVNTPVTFTVQSGGGQLATTNTGSPTLLTTLTLNTDTDGTAQAFYKQPATAGVTSQIAVTSGGAQTIFTTQSISAVPPPTAPAYVKVKSTAPGSIGLSWGAASPSSGGLALAGYNVYRDGVKLNGVPLQSTSYTDTTVPLGGFHTYVVRAVDIAGNESATASLTVAGAVSSTSGTFEVFTPAP